MRNMMRRAACAAALLAAGLPQLVSAADKEVIFFPATATIVANGDVTIGIQGRVFERPDHSLKRKLLARTAAGIMNVHANDLEQSAVFRARMGAFVSDSGGGVRVKVKIGDRIHTSPVSDAAGYFKFDVILPGSEADRIARDGNIPFQTVPDHKIPTAAAGYAVPAPAQGITVVTDIDDTIKITDMLDRKEKLRNTFLRPFREVPGMPQLYAGWKANLGPQIHFHVVSAGPWHMQSALAAFFAEKGFPPFTWDMRSIDATNPFIWPNELSPQARKFKTARIEALICRFPQRQLVLVGDSGEQDPEAYADIARKYPTHVRAIYIRDMKKPGQDPNRFSDLFPDALAQKFRLYESPAELPPPPAWSQPEAIACP